MAPRGAATWLDAARLPRGLDGADDATRVQLPRHHLWQKHDGAKCEWHRGALRSSLGLSLHALRRCR
eukprot:5284743-Pleurochrysis_carterae.AAC.1